MEYETSVCTEDYFYKSGFFWQSKEKVTRPVWKEPEIVQSFGECIRNCNLTAFHLLFMKDNAFVLFCFTKRAGILYNVSKIKMLLFLLHHKICVM